MESLRSVIASLEKGEFLASVDIQDAYLHIPIFPLHQRFLRFAVNNLHFQFTALPFGLASAPRVFTKVMSTVVSILHSRGIVILPYLDDLLIKGPTFQSCKENVDITLDTLSRLDVDLMASKVNAKVPSFVSRYRDPQAIAVDALDKVVLRPAPSFLPKVVSSFHINEDIVLPSFCPAPTHRVEKALHTLDLVRALRRPLQMQVWVEEFFKRQWRIYRQTLSGCRFLCQPPGGRSIHPQSCVPHSPVSPNERLGEKDFTTMFSFEAGRRCTSGEGNFEFETAHGSHIFNAIESAIKASRNESSASYDHCHEEASNLPRQPVRSASLAVPPSHSTMPLKNNVPAKQPESEYAVPFDKVVQNLLATGFGGLLGPNVPPQAKSRKVRKPEHIYDEPELTPVYDEPEGIRVDAWKSQATDAHEIGYEYPYLPGWDDYAVPRGKGKACPEGSQKQEEEWGTQGTNEREYDNITLRGTKES
ncbi:unnamed protein product [Ranitomeya imitator]|uniref:ribonuclease H n=1 Tax=Ranitomeya imitator TaxID=111125 RepID=A0ABN9LTH5_9NEOB|nr:unnamed protein product [Ranitomeya imitator]